MRRASSAKRGSLRNASPSGPQARRYVDAVENPGLRSAVIAEMLAIDPKIMPPIGLIQPLLHLGAIDAVYEMIFAALDEDPALSLIHI